MKRVTLDFLNPIQHIESRKVKRFLFRVSTNLAKLKGSIEMKNESPQIAVRVSQGILDALNECLKERSKTPFIRDAITEKLERDFGVKVAPELPKPRRIGQGKRNDLADNPERLAALKEQAAKMRERRWKKD